MAKFEKAVDLHKRGFSNQYIKRRTGWSLVQLRDAGALVDAATIRKHQVAYIRSKYSVTQIEDAYTQMLARHDDPYRASRGRSVVFLGCGFGEFDWVMRHVLGADAYATLRRKTRKIAI